MILRRLRARARGGRAAAGSDRRFRDVEERTRDLEVRAHAVLGGMTAGAWASLFRGTGVEPDGVRPYQAGDGIRAVDWRVTARRGQLHVREFVEERGLDVLVILDRSASLAESAGPAGKVAIEAAAAVLMASVRSDHAVGLLQVTDRVEHFVRPGRGDVHLRRLLWHLADLRALGKGTDLAAGLDAAASVLPTGSLVIVVSDLWCGGAQRWACTTSVARMAAHGAVMLIRVDAPTLLDVRDVGTVEIVDPESGRSTLYDSGSAHAREALHERARDRADWWAELARVARGPCLTLDARQPLADQLRRGLAARGRYAA